MTQKKIQAKEVLGTEYYNYNITSTNYNPSLNTTITITVTVTDVYGSPVNNLSTTLQRNGTNISSKNTNSSGVATWTYTCSASGLQKFHIGENTINVYVDNKAELGHTHSQYLTSHQDISGKANISDLGAVAFSNNYNDLTNKPNIPSGSVVDTTLSSNSDNAIANSTVKNALDTKLDKTHTSYKGKNVVTNASTGTIEFEEKNNHTHSEYLTSHQDISNKIDTAGTGLSKSGTTLNHSNSVTALTTASFKKVKYDSQGHVTGTSNVSASDLPSHTHTQSQITDFPSIPSSSGDLSDGSDLIKKSSTVGLIKNNGTIDTNSYLTTSDASSTYQPKLTSGSNIKTVNNESLLGSGNINIQGGSNVDIVTAWENTPSDSKVASEKLTKDTLDTKLDNALSSSTISIASGDSILFTDYDDGNKIKKTDKILATQVRDFVAHSTIGTAVNATQYAINDAIDTALGNKLSATKVTSWSSTPSDSNVASEKLVKDSLDGKSDTGHEHNADEIWADYETSGGYLNHITLDARLEEIESKIPTNNPVSDTESGLETILTYIDTNWEDY